LFGRIVKTPRRKPDKVLHLRCT